LKNKKSGFRKSETAFFVIGKSVLPEIDLLKLLMCLLKFSYLSKIKNVSIVSEKRLRLNYFGASYYEPLMNFA
jgi:hypothetical protein